MKYKHQWLSKPIYEALPFVFLLASISLTQITENVFVTLFAIYIYGYSIYIFAWRLVAREAIVMPDLTP